MKNKSIKLNKDKNFLYLFLLGGILTAFFSLIFFVFIDIFFHSSDWSNIPFYSVLISVLMEELFKLQALKLLLGIRNSLKNNNFFLIEGLFFAIGFTIFEIILIYLEFQSKAIFFIPIFILFSIHFLTTLILLMAIRKWIKWKMIALLYFFLAIILHLVYNLSIS